MRRRAGRPDPLHRLVRRSDRRVAVAIGWFGLLAVLNLTGRLSEDRLFEDAVEVDATVDADYRPGSGDLTVPVHIGERPAETREVYDAPLPAPGDVVRVEVAAGQPGVVRLSGSGYALPVDVAAQYGPLAVCAALAVGRRQFVRRVLRRARSGSPTFGLVGAIRPAPLSRYRCVLDLYGLDAAPGAAPVASVSLATTAGLPVDRLFLVECKGVPRPYALVVARVGDRVLWPSAPAIGAGRRPGRPAGITEPTDLVPTPAPAGVTVPRLVTRPGTWCAAGGLVLVVAVALVGRAGVARDDDRAETWERVPATVLAGDESSCSAEVTYRLGGTDHEAVVAVGDCAAVARGPGYVVLVDPADPDHALLLSGLYDPWTPLAYSAFAAAAGLWAGAGSVHDHRRVRAAVTGPWHRAVLEQSSDTTVVRAAADPPGTRRCWSSTSSGPLAGGVAVAGEVEPGGLFVVQAPGDDRLREHRGRNRARLDLPFRR